jgi:hypothetical protein
MPHQDTAQTIAEFCASEKISRAKYFDLRRKGRAPVEMRDGKWVRISPEAKQAWRRARECDAESTAA